MEVEQVLQDLQKTKTRIETSIKKMKVASKNGDMNSYKTNCKIFKDSLSKLSLDLKNIQKQYETELSVNEEFKLKIQDYIEFCKNSAQDCPEPPQGYAPADESTPLVSNPQHEVELRNESQLAYEMAKDNTQDMKEIVEGMDILNQQFTKMNTMVEVQQKQVDAICQNVEDTNDAVHDARENFEKAHVYQKKASKKLYMILACAAAIVVILILIIIIPIIVTSIGGDDDGSN